MAAIVNGTTVTLNGAIGFELFDDFFTYSEVLVALLQVGDATDLTIHLNSPGGYTDEGTAIANAIQRRAGKTTVVVEGVAMSAATYLACAADEIVMADGTLWMVHEPMVTLISANSDALASGLQAQTLLTDAYAKTYARKTGKTDAQVRAWMKAETYFGADEAIEAGFADRKSADVIDLVAVAPAWDYGRSYARAPQRLVALATSRQWDRPAQATITSEHRKEHPMPETVSASTHATATARIKAIMQDPEAKGRAKLAEHLAFDTVMDAEAAIKILQVAPAAGDEEVDPVAAYEASRLAAHRVYGAGLGGNVRDGKSDSGIVAAMKQRHGVK